MAKRLRNSQAEFVIPGLVFLWSFLMIASSRLENAALTWLIISGAIFVVSAVAILICRRSASIAFLLPGLLIFFKQNDSLQSQIGSAPVVDLLALMVALTLLVSLKRKEVTSVLSEGALIFVLLFFLLLALIVSMSNAFDANASRSEVATFAKDTIFAGLIAFSVRSILDLKRCINWIILASSFSAAIMIFDAWNGSVLFPTGEEATWQGSVRSSGASSESVPDAATMVLFGVLSASIFALRLPTRRTAYFCAALLGVAAIIASITRSAVGAGFLAAIFLLWRLRNERFFPGAMLIFGTILLCVILYMPQSMISKITALDGSTNDRTISRRLSYQEIGFDLFQTAPLLGIGAGNYRDRFASSDYRFVDGRGTEPRPLHNIYLQYFVEAGVLGGLAFLALIMSVWKALRRACHAQNSVLKHCAEALLIVHFSLCVQFLFLSSKSFLGFWIIVALAISVARLQAEEAK